MSDLYREIYSALKRLRRERDIDPSAMRVFMSLEAYAEMASYLQEHNAFYKSRPDAPCSHIGFAKVQLVDDLHATAMGFGDEGFRYCITWVLEEVRDV